MQPRNRGHEATISPNGARNERILEILDNLGQYGRRFDIRNKDAMMIGFWVTSDENDIVSDEIDGILIYEIFETLKSQTPMSHMIISSSRGVVEVTWRWSVRNETVVQCLLGNIEILRRLERGSDGRCRGKASGGSR
jgi:hypothetical protein